jgi:hypothetical protein
LIGTRLRQTTRRSSSISCHDVTTIFSPSSVSLTPSC